MAADKNKKKRDSSSNSEQSDESVNPVVRDKRRIDPETGEPRVASDSVAETNEGETDDETADDENSSGGSESVGAESGDDATISDEELLKFLENAEGPKDSSSEHLEDLKRVQAEYANYRKRVDRDRYVARELAVAEVMTGILPVLDDLDLARAHGDLEGSPLELVAQKIRTSFERYGLTQIGEVGEEFDPKFHEAIAQLPTKGVTVETIADVILPGYMLGERLLRAAKVAVSVPEG